VPLVAVAENVAEEQVSAVMLALVDPLVASVSFLHAIKKAVANKTGTDNNKSFRFIFFDLNFNNIRI